MTDDDARRMLAVLEQIRDQQKLQLERQAEAIAMQREHVTLFRTQSERAEKLQDRAEALHAKSTQLVTGSRKVIGFVLALIVVLVILLVLYVGWLMLRR